MHFNALYKIGSSEQIFIMQTSAQAIFRLISRGTFAIFRFFLALYVIVLNITSFALQGAMD